MEILPVQVIEASHFFHAVKVALTHDHPTDLQRIIFYRLVIFSCIFLLWKENHEIFLLIKQSFAPESFQKLMGVKFGIQIFCASIFDINRSISALALSMDRCKIGK